MFREIVDKYLDIFIHMGDLHYEDITKNDFNLYSTILLFLCSISFDLLLYRLFFCLWIVLLTCFFVNDFSVLNKLMKQFTVLKHNDFSIGMFQLPTFMMITIMVVMMLMETLLPNLQLFLLINPSFHIIFWQVRMKRPFIKRSQSDVFEFYSLTHVLSLILLRFFIRFLLL